MSEEKGQYKVYVTLVYTGIRADSKYKRSYIYVPLVSGKLDPQAYLSFTKPLMKMSIGAVTKHGRTDDDKTQMRGEYIGRYPDTQPGNREEAEKQVANWTAADAEARGVIEMAADTGGNADLAKILQPIISRYAKTNRQGKAALLAKVILTIQSQSFLE